MTQVTIDADLRARLHGLKDQLEFRDERGELLGHFLPARKGPVTLLPGDACPYSSEELLRMRNESGGKPLAEILKQLEPQ
jgi:hypothetical protein